jgi:hypothetical protein
MNKDFVEYEEALELKQLGFDEPCFGVYATKDGYVRKSAYDENGDAPTYSQAFRWFREKGIENEIHSDFDRMLGYNRGYIPVVQFIEFYNNGDCYETYEEAELVCLKKLIEIVKEK